MVMMMMMMLCLLNSGFEGKEDEVLDGWREEGKGKGAMRFTDLVQ